jgi:hypothetical protein
MPGSTFGGLTVVSRLASGSGWITPLGGTEFGRLSGVPVAPSDGSRVGDRADGDCAGVTSENAGPRQVLNRQMAPTTNRSIEDLLRPTRLNT